jgi:hypothetical protein
MQQNVRRAAGKLELAGHWETDAKNKEHIQPDLHAASKDPGPGESL